MLHRRQKYTRNHPWSLNSIRNSVVRGDETRGKTIVPSPGGSSLNFPVISPESVVETRATRVLYVCFSFPVEKSLIIGHGNAKWADQRDISLSFSCNRPIPSSFPLPLKTSFFTITVTILVLIKKRGREEGKKKRGKGERNHEDSLSGANNAVPRFPQEYFITKATVTAIING